MLAQRKHAICIWRKAVIVHIYPKGIYCRIQHKQKILSWLNAQDKVLRFLRQVGCYKLVIKKYIYSNFKSEKNHSGFKNHYTTHISRSLSSCRFSFPTLPKAFLIALTSAYYIILQTEGRCICSIGLIQRSVKAMERLQLVQSLVDQILELLVMKHSVKCQPQLSYGKISIL